MTTSNGIKFFWKLNGFFCKLPVTFFVVWAKTQKFPKKFHFFFSHIFCKHYSILRCACPISHMLLNKMLWAILKQSNERKFYLQKSIWLPSNELKIKPADRIHIPICNKEVFSSSVFLLVKIDYDRKYRYTSLFIKLEPWKFSLKFMLFEYCHI